MNKLTELEIEEVSLVDAGANPAAHIKLFKRKEEKIMAAEKLLQETEPKVEKPSVEKSETKPEEPKVEKPPVEKRDEQPAPTPKVEEPKVVPKVEAVDKAADLERERAELAKAQETVNALIGALKEHVDKADTAELTAVAKKYELLGFKTEELVPQLKSLKQFPELYKQLITSLDTSLAAVEKARTFEEIGKSGYGSANGGQIEAFAKEIHKSKPNLSWHEALDEAFVQHPELQY